MDGTLYPNYRFNLRAAPLVAGHLRLFMAFVRARTALRRARAAGGSAGLGAQAGSFYERQARLAAEALSLAPEDALRRIDTQFYARWERCFRGIRPFRHARETLEALREGGIKLGVLSDLPPEVKLRHLGLEGLFDVVLCSERTGSLKPDGAPFAALAEGLGIAPAQILYVGNKALYDAAGAKGAGMKAALLRRGLHRGKDPRADFVFSDYRQLLAFVRRGETGSADR